jgi:hypothetical protein
MILASGFVANSPNSAKHHQFFVSFKNSGKLAKILPEREMSGTAISISADFVKAFTIGKKNELPT